LALETEALQRRSSRGGREEGGVAASCVGIHQRCRLLIYCDADKRQTSRKWHKLDNKASRHNCLLSRDPQLHIYNKYSGV